MIPAPAVAPVTGRIAPSLVLWIAGAGTAAALAAWLVVAGSLAVAIAVLVRQAARERRAAARDALLAGAAARLRAEHGLARSLAAGLRELGSELPARGVTLVARDSESGRTVAWVAAGGRDGEAPYRELSPAAGAEWLFETSACAWDAQRRRGGWRIVALDAAGGQLPASTVVPETGVAALAARLGARRLAAVDFGSGSGSEWTGRLLLADPSPPGPPLEALRFLQRLVFELGGIVQSRYRLGRLRARVGAMERGRIARDLHDGTIQSLVGVEMELEVLRRRAAQRGSPLAEDLQRVQALLQGEILDLRDTMQRLKPIELQPAQLVGFLDSAVARFERDSGIQSLFDCEVEDVDLPPRVCREIARIVLEALHNVRKHSGARHLVVRFGPAAGGGFRLVVDDDGRGFPFAGELNQEQLERGGRGPFVIQERVRALGGRLAIVSSPRGGARLEIHLPGEQP